MEQATLQWKGMASAIKEKLDAFWAGQEQHRQTLVSALISLHLLVSLNDLSEWEDDPEAWFHANEGVLLEHELRGIAEIVLRVLTPIIFRMLCAVLSLTVFHTLVGCIVN
jgi:hypothetical protein